ncbi:methylmalonyl-CoA epimerase [Halonotius terrestris]|uniref:Methylmalonyl-CoA epimerase n=1 Tax=Halonotius terrestris TaxID=2487750 RepID=A0A8J8P810_9EURY|nr:methylmalonyl-CoA epimerase [Halonotius terrestris]TQQ79275.1 methylmalonyl-CoA epimerase [Halonotius terrestris]
MRVHHAGIATDDADGLADLFAAVFDAPVAHSEQFDGIEIRFLELDNGYFELLEPTDDGPIADYLNSHGSGIHHLAIETDDIEAALQTASEHRIDLIDEEPRPGAWGHDVAFLHPSSTGGVLIEFVTE